MQTFLALLIVAGCVLLVAWRLWRTLRPRGGKTACGCAGGCPALRTPRQPPTARDGRSAA